MNRLSLDPVPAAGGGSSALGREAEAPKPAAYLAMLVVLGLGLTAPIVLRFYWPAGGGLDVTGHQIGRDFINTWAAPQLAFGGRLATLFDLQGYHAAIGELFGRPLPFHNWSYPPTALLIFWPFAQLRYAWGLAAWTLTTFAALAVVVIPRAPAGRRGWALALLALAPACLINAVGGQNGFLVGALFLGGVLCLDRRPLVAGLLFGLMSFKPQLGIVLAVALPALGAWRAFASAAVSALALAGLSVALLGLEPWRLFIDVTTPYNSLVLSEYRGFYTSMMASVFGGMRNSGIGYAPAMAVQLAAAIVVLGSAAVAVRRAADPCLRALVLAAAMPLVTPYALNYDLCPLAGALVWTLTGRLPWRGVHLFAWLAPAALMTLNIAGLGVAPIALAASFAAAVGTAYSGSPPIGEKLRQVKASTTCG